VADTLKLTILSPERRLLESVIASSVTLPSSEGQVQVLPGHASMVGTLQTGFFRYTKPDGTGDQGVISSGFFEVGRGEVSVMAETLELKGEIDVDRARESQRKSEQMLKEADLDEHSFKKYQLKLERSIIRQQVANHPAGHTTGE
jgi:F-type H+-transporting ATPase subunit epsilon